MYVDDDTYEFLIEMIDKKINEIKNGYNPYARCGKVMDAERRGFAINSLRELKKEFGQNNLHFSHCKYFKRPFQVNQSSCIGLCTLHPKKENSEYCDCRGNSCKDKTMT